MAARGPIAAVCSVHVTIRQSGSGQRQIRLRQRRRRWRAVGTAGFGRSGTAAARSWCAMTKVVGARCARDRPAWGARTRRGGTRQSRCSMRHTVDTVTALEARGVGFRSLQGGDRHHHLHGRLVLPRLRSPGRARTRPDPRAHPSRPSRSPGSRPHRRPTRSDDSRQAACKPASFAPDDSTPWPPSPAPSASAAPASTGTSRPQPTVPS